MLKRKWWLPIRVGIPLALIAGLPACHAVLREQQYVSYHLYKTTTLIVASHIDYYAVLFVPVLFVMLALFSLAGYLRGAARVTARVLLALGMLVLFAIAVHLLRYDRHVLQVLGKVAGLGIAKVNLLSILLGACGAILLLIAGRRQLKRALQQTGRILTRPVRIAGVVLLHLVNVLSLLLIIGFLGIHLALGFFTLRNTATLKDRPNVILIMVDTLRADHMGCYGYARNTTPHIDRFAGESTLFSKAIAQAPWTPWSVFSFMSSRYPDIFQVRTATDPNSQRFLMLAEVLKDQGYTTDAVISNALLETFPEFRQGFEHFDSSTTVNAERGLSTSPEVTALALQRLERLKDTKFFLYLVYFDPHAPYTHHSEFPFNSDSSTPRPAKLSPAPEHSTLRPSRCAAAGTATANYDSEIAFTDNQVGRVLDALKQHGLYDDSLIIFLSDHGEELLEHGRMGHLTTLYDEVLSVPLIIKLPGQRQGTVVDGTFPLIDLSPSVLGVLGANNPAYRAVGTDAGIKHVQRCQEKPIFSATGIDIFSVRSNRQKYILHALTSQQELYNLTSDPWEQHNLAGKQPKEVTGWRRTLQMRTGQPLTITGGGPTSSYSKEQLDTLRSLGYLQ